MRWPLCGPWWTWACSSAAGLDSPPPLVVEDGAHPGPAPPRPSTAATVSMTARLRILITVPPVDVMILTILVLFPAASYRPLGMWGMGSKATFARAVLILAGNPPRGLLGGTGLAETRETVCRGQPPCLT